MTEPQWAIDEIKQIQSNGIDWFGNPLVVDGKRGPKTDFWIGVLSTCEQRQAITKLCLGHFQKKIQEATGNNDGPFCDMVLKPAKMKNVAWCIAYCSYLYRTCGVEWPVYHVSTYALIQWAKKENLLVEEPMLGDIEAFLYPKQPGKDWTGHGRIVLAWDKATKETYGCDGNNQNKINVGRRKHRENRYFIRPKGLTDEGKGFIFPLNTFYLDGTADR